MSLKLNERYPGRFSNPSSQYPQGAFKNRTAPGAQDGSYLEKDWANDLLGFLSRLLTVAAISPNGNVDTALSSQYFEALQKITLKRTDPFGDIKQDGASAVAAALSNLGLSDISKVGVPRVDVGSTFFTLKTPYLDGTTRRYFMIHGITTTVPTNNNGTRVTVTYPTAYDSAPIPILGSTVGNIGASGLNEGMNVLSITNTTCIIASEWNNWTSGPVYLLTVGIVTL